MKYFTDGFTIKTNPSDTGGGFTVINENGDLIKRKDITKQGFTNNEGELLGVLETARICQMYDEISTDSMCIIAWIRKGKSKPRKDLFNQIQEAKQLIESKYIDLIWESREVNLAGHFNEQFEKDHIKNLT